MYLKLGKKSKRSWSHAQASFCSQMCEDFDMQKESRCWASNTRPHLFLMTPSKKKTANLRNWCVCVCAHLYDEAFVIAAAALWYQLVFQATSFLIQLHHWVFTSCCQDWTRSSGLQKHTHHISFLPRCPVFTRGWPWTPDARPFLRRTLSLECSACGQSQNAPHLLCVCRWGDGAGAARHPVSLSFTIWLFVRAQRVHVSVAAKHKTQSLQCLRREMHVNQKSHKILAFTAHSDQVSSSLGWFP